MTTSGDSERLRRLMDEALAVQRQKQSEAEAGMPSRASMPAPQPHNCKRCGVELDSQRTRWGCIHCEACEAQADQERKQAEEERYREEQERRRQHWAEVMSDAQGQTDNGVPPQYHGASFDDFPAIRADLESFARREIPFITLVGSNGTGKTRALYAIYRAVLSDARNCAFYSMPLLMKHLQALSGHSTREEMDHIESITQSNSIVLLDELGACKETPFTINNQGIIIGEREKWNRPTAVATNLSVREIAEMIDKRIADRIAGGVVREMTGKSKRLHR